MRRASLAMAICAAAAMAAPPRSLHIVVEGDLDSAKLGEEIARELDSAEDETTPWVVLEFSGNRARRDVVWRLARSVEDCRSHVAVLIRDPRDKEAAWNFMLLGLAAEVFATSDTAVRFEAGDELDEWVPSDFDREKMDRELAGLVWAGLVRRTIDPSFATILCERTSSVFVERFDAGWRLSAEGDEHAEEILDVAPSGRARGRAGAEALRRAGISDESCAMPVRCCLVGRRPDRSGCCGFRAG